MKAIYALIAVLLLTAVGYLGAAAGLDFLFGVIIPYLSVLLFFVGFTWRIFDWMKSPVPFRIPTTCGQAKSLKWIKRDELESPSGFWGVVGRMSLEVLFFRSLSLETTAFVISLTSASYKNAVFLFLLCFCFVICVT